MKIVFIHNLYKPYAKGGAERIVAMTAQGFKDRGDESVIVSLNPSKKDISETVDGIKVWRIHSPNLIFYGDLDRLRAPLRLVWHFLDMINIATAWKVRRIVKRENPDVVFLHNLKGLSYCIPLFLSRWPKILVLHDAQLLTPRGVIFYGKENSFEHTNILTKLYAAINKKLFFGITQVISPSEWLLDVYKRNGFFKNSDTRVLPNPAPNTKSINHESITAERDPASAVGVKNDWRIHFLFVGQLEESKGLIPLVIFLKKSQILFRLTIVGDGSERRKMSDLIQNDDRFMHKGKVDHEKLSALYNDADFLVVPSLVYENCPSVILESFSHGLPVIASRIGGIPEFVSDNENGFLFPPGDYEAFGATLTARMPREDLQRLRRNAIVKAQSFTLVHYINVLREYRGWRVK